MPTPPRRRSTPPPGGIGLARALSKRGLCSRTEAARWIADGRVRVDGKAARSAEQLVDPARSRIEVDGAPAPPAGKLYLAMNKPRGLLTTRADPAGRPTVYGLLHAARFPWVSPVGRLDQASEGLLLFSNDTQWANALTDPARAVPKIYHVQVAGIPDDGQRARMREGVRAGGERLAALSAEVLRAGRKNCWLEIVLAEGRNRHIRRMLEALGFETLRLIRVAIGPFALGELPKGAVRRLTAAERKALAASAGGKA